MIDRNKPEIVNNKCYKCIDKIVVGCKQEKKVYGWDCPDNKWQSGKPEAKQISKLEIFRQFYERLPFYTAKSDEMKKEIENKDIVKLKTLAEQAITELQEKYKQKIDELITEIIYNRKEIERLKKPIANNIIYWLKYNLSNQDEIHLFLTDYDRNIIKKLLKYFGVDNV